MCAGLTAVSIHEVLAVLSLLAVVLEGDPEVALGEVEADLEGVGAEDLGTETTLTETEDLQSLSRHGKSKKR